MPIPFLNSISLNKNEVQDFKVFNLATEPTLTTTDVAYLWYNTSAARMRYWTGTTTRDILDTSSTISGAQISGAITGRSGGLTGGADGSLVYQSATNTTSFLSIGSANQVLRVNSSGIAPEWVSQSSLSVGSASTATTASNIASGALGSIPYQALAGSTVFLSIGTNTQVITSNGSIPAWTNQSSLAVGRASNLSLGAAGSLVYQSAANTTAFLPIASNVILTGNGTSPSWTPSLSVTVGKAIDIALGSAGDLLYQSASNDTSFLGIGTAGQVLTSSGTAPQWSNQSSLSVGSATTAGSVSNALTAGSYLTSTGTYNGSVARTFAVDATNANTGNKIVARDINGDFSARNISANRITGLANVVSGDPSDVATNKGYVDSVAQGLDVKAFCTVASTANITLSSPGTGLIDGVDPATFTSGTTRILVKNQTTASENGIYIWNGSGSAMTRSTDADTWDELVGAYTFVSSGTTNASSGWVTTIVAGGTLGTTAVTWTQFSQAGTYSVNRGLAQSGNVFSFAQNTAYTQDTIPYASGSSTIGFIGAGNADQVLRVPGIGGTPAFGAIDISKSAAVTGTLAVGNGGTGITSLGAGIATFLGSPTSANLATAVTDETGTGALVFASSPTLVTPTLGVASATSINKVSITAPATGSTLTIAEGKTLTASNTLTFTGTDSSSVAFGAGGTVAYTGGNLGQFSLTTSSELAGIISDETGTGALVFAGSPTLTGTPVSTTAAPDTNTTQIATTAYVLGQASSTTPASLGTAATGTSLKYARADHVHAFPTINLTSNVTNVLPVANGGTGAATFVSGCVLFGNGTSALNTSSNLFWDNTNNRLGVGTNTPGFTVDILSSLPQIKLTGSGTSSDLRINAAFGASDLGAIGTNGASPFMLFTNNTERLRVKSTGQVNFTGLASDPAGAAGDVYYSTGNYFKYHNGTAWQSFPRKYSAALSGAVGTDFTVTHNLNSQDVVVQVRKTASPYDLVYTDVKMASANTVTISFASSVTPADYTVTVIG